MLGSVRLALITLLIAPALTVWDPEVTMNIGEIIRHWGYPMEVDEVETSDGFLLELYRIPHERNEQYHDNSTRCRPAMLLVHGFVSDGSQFVLNLPESSPAFVFADAGFDVFIANVRGTSHGKKHRRLRTTDGAFWNFSVDEHTNLDLPPIIDKTLLISGQQSLLYVGHSQGAIIALSLLATRAEYNDKVRALFLWGAESTSSKTRGILGALIHYAPLLKPIAAVYLGLLGSHEFLPSWTKFYATIISICVPEHMHDLCRGILDLIQGPSTAPYNMTRLPVYIAHIPAGTSTKTFIHYAQNVLIHDENGKFDYGFWNLRQYGKTRPPTYNYSNVNSPVYFFWSRNDFFGSPNETQALIGRLRPDVFKEAFEIPSYAHADYALALDATEKVFMPMINIIQREYPGCK